MSERPTDAAAERILVVDDNEASRYTVARYLRAAGYEVVEAAGGREALALAQSQPDLVLLDVKMPDLPGFEVCARLKGDPRTRDIPVIHLSASFTDADDRAAGLEHGADGYLVAPVQPRELLAHVRAFLRVRRAERRLRENEARLRLAMQAGNAGAWDWNVRTGETTWSDELRRLLGLAPDAMMPIERCLELVHPADRETVRARVGAVAAGEAAPSLELRVVRRRDGATRWIDVRGEVVDRDGGGPVRIAGIVSDVTERREVEDQLRVSEARFRKIFEHAKTGIAITELDGRFVTCNPAHGALLGSTQEQLRDTRCTDWVHPEDRDENLAAIRRLADGAAPFFELENRYLRRDGTVVWVHKFVSLLPDDAGRPAFLLMLVTDVTERRRTEAALRSALEELEATYEAAPVGLCVLDRDLRYVRVNERLARMNGMSAGAHIGRTVREVVPNVADFAESLANRIFTTGEPARDVEFAGETPAQPGFRRIWNEQWYPMRSSDGAVVGINVVVEDVTARREAEAEREHLLGVAQRARDEADASRELLARVQRMIDVRVGAQPLDELLGTLLELVRTTLRADTATVLLRDGGADGGDGGSANLLRVRVSLGLRDESMGRVTDLTVPIGEGFSGRIAATGAPLVWDEIDHAKMDSPHFARTGIRSLAGVPLEVNGRNLGVVTIGSRMPGRFRPDEVRLLAVAAERIALAVMRALAAETDRRTMARLEEASRAKDEFLAILSHELRAPLNAMLGWVSIVRSGAVSGPKLADAAARIERNIRIQTELVNDLLDVSRIISGKLKLERSPVHFEGVVGAAVEMMRPQADAREVRLELDLGSLDATVSGDAARLGQIVVNLVGNAIKFTPAGGRVSVALRKDGGEAELVVRDTGEGISPDFLPHIFHRFSQADLSTTRKNSGLGLGLSIVRHLVAEHGGRISAESPGPGAGATFTVRLPLEAGTERQARKALPAPCPATLEGLDMLVVDDDADSRDALALLLESAGGRVRVASSAREALDAVAAERPDVLVTDIAMAGEDGYWLMEQLGRRTDMAGVVTIAVTGYASREDEVRARSAGFDRHVAKPVDPDVLASLVAMLAAHRRCAPEGGDGRTSASDGHAPG